VALALAPVLLGLLLLAPAPARAAPEVQFTQRADRSEVGTGDVFRVTVELVDPPADARLELPQSPDFESLGTSQSTSRSFSMVGGGAPVISTRRTVTLRLRARRAGTLTLPPSRLVGAGRTWSTEPVRVKAVPGRLAGADEGEDARGGADPFRGLPFPGAVPPAGGAEERLAEDELPRRDADLFMRTTVDREEAFVGQQVTMSVWVYSRVDLSSVDAVTMPRLEGFWTEEVDAPTQLSGEPRTVNGVPYRAYLLRRRALFPMRAGELTVGPAEADITTGFLFAGHRVHRRTRPVAVRVKPLPPGGPAGVRAEQVGRWRLTAEAPQTETEVGQPVTVRLVLEGEGNVRNVPVPRLQAPPAFRTFEPSSTESLSAPGNRVGGRRVVEYLLMPLQAGTFTLPALALPYFEPESGRYETAASEPLTLVVRPGAGGPAAVEPPGPAVAQGPGAGAVPGGAPPAGAAGAVRPVRAAARLEAPAGPLHAHALFWPAVLGPVALWGLSLLSGALKARRGREAEAGVHARQARAAREHLAEAERLRDAGPAADFHAALERALRAFLESELKEPVRGLTRDALAARLAAGGVGGARRERLLAVLEACEHARYAPEAGGAAARGRLLADAVDVMDRWERA
jgi:hypothetical protein